MSIAVAQGEALGLPLGAAAGVTLRVTVAHGLPERGVGGSDPPSFRNHTTSSPAMDASTSVSPSPSMSAAFTKYGPEPEWRMEGVHDTGEPPPSPVFR